MNIYFYLFFYIHQDNTIFFFFCIFCIIMSMDDNISMNNNYETLIKIFKCHYEY